MARLNEPPVAPSAAALAPGATVENIDILKRRFIRQNRDLAKNNSAQSLRIRSLELEIERILTDNLELRARIVELENQLFDAQAEISGSAVDELTRALYGKIAELTGLVRGVDALKSKRRRDVDRERILSPSKRQYRDRQPLSEVMRDTLMPTIVEGKKFLRRSLEADVEQTFNRLSGQSSSSGSPDIGPPPIARLDYEDSGNDHSKPAGPPPQTAEELLPESLSVNLETRRRRRESHAHPDVRRHSILAQSPVKGGEEASTMLRTGAKRKLADREVEKPSNAAGPTDFSFTRKSSSLTATQSTEEVVSKVERPIRERLADQGDRVRPQSPQSKPARRVLSEKSVNLSPRKPQLVSEDKLQKGGLDKSSGARPASITDKDRSALRSRRLSSIPLPPAASEVAPSTTSIPAPDPLEIPSTGVLEDMLSPVLSNPSPYLSESLQKCDTPPPSDLSALSNTTDGVGQRPSRRARSAVNYAEPSLIAKMRRPDKNMVDAVSGIRGTASRAVANNRKDSESASVCVKKEEREETERSWKDLPLSQEERSPSVVKKREAEIARKAIPKATKYGTDADLEATASTTQVPLLTAGRKRREPSSSSLLTRFTAPASVQSVSNTEADAAAKKLEELDLYEFKDSSSPSSTLSGSPASKPQVQIRGHRRHSSVPKEPRAGDLSNGRVKAVEEKNLGRRRSMVL